MMMQNHDDNFDGFLSEQLQQSHTYLPDDNFTAQLIAKLPAQKKLTLWQERLIILFPCALISLLVLSQFSLIAVAIKSFVWLSLISGSEVLKMALVVSVVAFMTAICWFAKECRLL
jgi:predicted anti-sigma-YlaC factor YlaD